jgi:hypothetical protein
MVLNNVNNQNPPKKSPKIPEIIEYLFTNYKVDRFRYANCTICNESLSDVLISTSNFVRHMRLSHPERVEDYFEFKNSRKKMRKNELSLDFKLTLSQENIDFIIVKYLIIDCGLPFRFVNFIFKQLNYLFTICITLNKID